MDAAGTPIAFKTPPRPGEGTVVVPEPKDKPLAENVTFNIAPDWTPAPANVYPKRLNRWPAVGI